jgi:predicted Zn finger-like uncharacterized protein
MIIRCDNCSVSLQLDETKVPNGNFTVRCPRCQNLLRANRDANGNVSPPVQQLAANQAAPALPEGATEFAEKESEFEINSAMRSLLQALQSGKGSAVSETTGEKAAAHFALSG